MTGGLPGILLIMRASAAAIVVSALAFQSAPAAAQSVSEFYRGKTIKLLLPTAPGGGRALYALPFSEAFGRHIPGNPKILPVFMPGAGGSTAINNASGVAEPDGLTIVSPLKGAVAAQAIGDPSVRYDLSKFNWIGRITDATQIFFTSSAVSARTIEDFRQQEIIVGSVGRASVTYQLPAFSNHVLGTKFKIVTGYRSAGANNMSVEIGETQGAFTTWNDIQSYHSDWLRDGKVRIVTQIALHRLPELAEVPLLADFATNESDRALIEFMSTSSELGQTYAAPPGVPDYIAAGLRDAFNETMKDADYIDKLQRAKIQFNPMIGQELGALVNKTLGTSKAVIERYKNAIN